MAAVPAWLLPHRVTVEAPRDGSEGPTYGPPATVGCRLDGRIETLASGEHQSTIKLYAQLTARGQLVVGARVTTPAGNTARVSAVAVHEDGGAGGWEHVEATLTGGS